MTNCSFQLKLIINFFKWFPVVFITTIIAWSYFAYIFALCIYFVQNIFERIVLLFFYHLILLVFLWSYVQTIFTVPLKPPNDFYLNLKEMDYFTNISESENKSKFLEQLIDKKDLIALCRNANGSVRFCDICCCIKPDRSHHCSSCDTCVLKMDHHCPWVNNCVGFHNYKFFVIFLLQGVLYCAYILASSCRYFIAYWKNQTKSDNHILSFNLVFLFLVAFLFMVALMSLGGYHIFLVLKNQTTLESFRRPYLAGNLSPKKELFNLGLKINFYQVFGDLKKYWCLPVASSKGDGILFQTRYFRQIESCSLVNDV